MSDLFVESWGTWTPVVLVHGSLATGAEEWQAQRPLADDGFQLLVVDRRGYGHSPAADGEDFVRDGEDVADVMGDGAHLVGHSYGGLGILFAAARRPDATLSVTLLEPGAFGLGQHDLPSGFGGLTWRSKAPATRSSSPDGPERGVPDAVAREHVYQNLSLLAVR